MKFDRCEQCGNIEPKEEGQPVGFCDGGGDPLRRHPRTRMVEKDAAFVRQVFGETDETTDEQRQVIAKEAAERLGVTVEDLEAQGTDAFVTDPPGPATTVTAAERTADTEVSDQLSAEQLLGAGVTEQQLRDNGWTQDSSGNWQRPAEQPA